jgi:ATP-dependent DNA helicase RecQ
LLDSLPDGPHLLRRQRVNLPPPPRELHRRYVRPSLKDINLGFAGRFDSGHPMHAALARLVHGAPLAVRLMDGAWNVFDGDGVAVGRMARGFAPPSTRDVISARVRCILSWNKEHAEAKYGPPRCDRWEIPLPELILEE